MSVYRVPLVPSRSDGSRSRLDDLAFLLAGPALSLPNMLVLIKVMGAKKRLVFCSLIVLVATLSGMLYGQLG